MRILFTTIVFLFVFVTVLAQNHEVLYYVGKTIQLTGYYAHISNNKCWLVGEDKLWSQTITLQPDVKNKILITTDNRHFTPIRYQKKIATMHIQRL